MATPIKSLNLIKNVLSPRTPNLLSISPQLLPSNKSHSRNLRKKLDFSSQLKVPTEKYNLIINTPTKIDLMKNGLKEMKNKVDILGIGAFGIVVKGNFKDVPVAVKVVKMEKNTKIPELNALKLTHKNLVKILEIVTNPLERNAVILMEFLEGTAELQTILENNELSVKLKKKFIENICAGLDYCHENSVLHLDIKPRNILIFNGDQCKICDFGNSCTTKNLEIYEFHGTVTYSAPELLKGMKPTKKCDIFSLGITIWQMEYRKNPYEEFESIESVLYKVVKNKIRPKYESKNDILTKLFESCWHENPIRRPEIAEILKIVQNL